MRPNLSLNVGVRYAHPAAVLRDEQLLFDGTLDDIWGVSGYAPGCDPARPRRRRATSSGRPDARHEADATEPGRRREDLQHRLEQLRAERRRELDAGLGERVHEEDLRRAVGDVVLGRLGPRATSAAA